MKFKKIDPNTNDMVTIYHLMISGIAPRPIALVGSTDKNNIDNLAPFSFFNGFGANPPIIGFSPALSGKTGLPKDTLLNIKETKEFTVSVVTSDIVNQVSLSSCAFDRDVDEFVKAGFTKRPSEIISPSGVSESPFIMECKLHNIIELGGKPGSGNLILGEVVLFHVSNDILYDGSKIDSEKINHVGRAGGPWYTEIRKSLFQINKPDRIGVGFDNLPKFLLNSKIPANYLAKLAGIAEIPSLKETQNLENLDIDDFLNKLIILIDQNDIVTAWQLVLQWNTNNE
jgi:flavin reductase (DIM6/NTAB) family NADH-FMN oxidoreductase RutF